MVKDFRPTLMRYGVALLATALAIVLRILLDPLLGDLFPFAALFFAVFVMAWYGGFGPALTTTLAGAVASSIFLLPPRAEIAVAGFENQAGVFLYLLIGIGIAALGGSMRTARLRAEAHAREALQRQQQLMEEIRQRQQAEDALRHSQQRFETFMNHSPATVYIKDEKGRYLYVNPLLERLFHLHRADWLGKTDPELFSAEWAEQYRENDQQVITSGQMLQVQETSFHQGSPHHWLSFKFPLEDASGNRYLGGMSLDITALKQAEQQLQQQREQLRVTLTSIGDAVIATDPEGRVTFLNPVAETLTGWTSGEAEGTPLDAVFKIVNEQTRQPVESPVKKVLREGGIVGLANHTVLLAKDGTERPIDDSAAPIRDKTGKLLGVVLVFRDVTERRQFEEERRHLAAIVESSQDAVISVDLNGTILSWNSGAEQLYGYTAEEAVGQSLSILIPSDHADELPDIMQRIRRGERIQHYETARVSKEGNRIEVSLAISPVRDAQGQIIGASKIARDITDKQQAERLRNARLSVTQILAQATEVQEAVLSILQSVCKSLDWQVSGFWEIDPHHQIIRCTQLWPSSYITEYQEFLDETRRLKFSLNGNLPGRVWTSGKPLWIADVTKDSNFMRADVAAKSGLRGGFACPVSVAGKVIGVMEFFSREQRAADADLMEMLSSLGGQLGQFIERKRAEESLQANQQLVQSLLDNTPATIYMKDRAGRLLLVNRRFADLAGKEVDDIVGRTDREVFGNEHLAEIEANDRRVFDEGRAIEFEERLTVAGELRTYRSIKAPITAMGGADIVLCGITLDITEQKLAEEALRESERRFRQLADVMPQIVWTADAEGMTDYYNRRWYELTGLKAEKHEQGDWQSFVHPDDVDAIKDHWRRSLQSGAPFQIEIRLKDAVAGAYHWHLARCVPVRNATGQIIRWYGTSTDIDEQKRAAEVARFLAEASAALASLVNHESTLQLVAQLAVPFFADWCAVDMLAADGSLRRLAVAHIDPAKVALAHDLYRRFPPNPEAPNGVWNILRTGKPELVSEISDELLKASAKDEELLRILRKLGLKSYIGVPLSIRGKTLGVLTFIMAESNRRYTKGDLSMAEDLTHRAAVAIDNANLYQALQESDRRKTEFLATLAHELRNPLAPIRTGLELIKLAKGDPATLEQTRSMMERQTQQLITLVDDLLDLSRIARGKLELRKCQVNLSDVVQSATEASKPFIDQTNHQLTVSLPDLPIYLNADPHRLAQVLSNLLNNAAKYTPEGGRIWLQAERQGNNAVISVRDNGLGISSEMVDRIFEMFAQLDRPLERGYKGLGIGLPLVKSLVEMHGGRIEVRSEGQNQGSEFIVRLPIPEEAAVEDPKALPLEEKTDATNKRRVLVVDDNRAAADILAMVVKMLGNDVWTANDGQQAVEMAAEIAPDVILMDLGMPKMNGYEAARLIRQQPWGKKMMLVALTGWGQEEDKQRTKDAGFDHHLVKPAEPAELRRLFEVAPILSNR